MDEEKKNEEKELKNEELEEVAGGHIFHIDCEKFQDENSCEHQLFCGWFNGSCHFGLTRTGVKK